MFCNTLVVQINTHWLVVILTKSLSSKEYPICRPNGENVRVLVISGESDFLTVLSILLYSECNSQFFWCLGKAVKIMQRHEMSFGIVEIPIDSNEGLNDLVAQRIFELINFGLSFLCYAATLKPPTLIKLKKSNKTASMESRDDALVCLAIST